MIIMSVARMMVTMFDDDTRKSYPPCVCRPLSWTWVVPPQVNRPLDEPRPVWRSVRQAGSPPGMPVLGGLWANPRYLPHSACSRTGSPVSWIFGRWERPHFKGSWKEKMRYIRRKGKTGSRHINTPKTGVGENQIHGQRNAFKHSWRSMKTTCCVAFWNLSILFSPGSRIYHIHAFYIVAGVYIMDRTSSSPSDGGV
jgi:hypothetical protein